MMKTRRCFICKTPLEAGVIGLTCSVECARVKLKMKTPQHYRIAKKDAPGFCIPLDHETLLSDDLTISVPES